MWFLELKMSQVPVLGPFNMTHGLAESSSQLGIQNIANNTKLQDGEHYALSLSSYSGYLETNIKMLFSSLKHLVCFIKQHSLRGYFIEQFPTILGVNSYVWNLLQAVSKASQDHFKISPQSNVLTLMEVMRTVYSPNPIPTLFSDVEMAVIVPETEEIAFTLVTNKKSKRKAKAFSLLSTDSRNKILLVSRAPSPPRL